MVVFGRRVTAAGSEAHLGKRRKKDVLVDAESCRTRCQLRNSLNLVRRRVMSMNAPVLYLSESQFGAHEKSRNLPQNRSRNEDLKKEIMSCSERQRQDTFCKEERKVTCHLALTRDVGSDIPGMCAHSQLVEYTKIREHESRFIASA